MPQDITPRNRTANISVTAEEKDAIAMVRLYRQRIGQPLSESELLRTMLIADVVAEAERIGKALADLPIAQSA